MARSGRMVMQPTADFLVLYFFYMRITFLEEITFLS